MAPTATRFAPRGADTFRLNLTPSGFEIHSTGAHDSRRVTVGWNEISKIDAYQRDQFQKNIFLVFALKDGSHVELNENLPGWTDVIDALPKNLPGCLPRGDWWRGSSGEPASRKEDPNWRTIYYRYSISGMGSR
ncbi:MAG: hypothetical protein ABIP12_03110 [Terriglobales bacterium]